MAPHLVWRTIGSLVTVATAEGLLVHLGRTYGSTAAERRRRLPGDDIVADPRVVTSHAVTIDAPPDCVWLWLGQMGWGRGGWYTARWVDRLPFPANGASAEGLVPELQGLRVGDFIPDGPPHTRCGLIVEGLEPGARVALHESHPAPVAQPNTHELVVGPRAAPARRRAANLVPSGPGGPPRRVGSSWAVGWASCPPTSSCRGTCCAASCAAPSDSPAGRPGQVEVAA